MWTTFLNIENDCNCSSSFVKNLFRTFRLWKEIEYFVDFRKIGIRLKQFSENFVGYLRNGFLITSLNVNGCLYLLSLYVNTRCWFILVDRGLFAKYLRSWVIATEDGNMLLCLHWRQYVQYLFDENENYRYWSMQC